MKGNSVVPTVLAREMDATMDLQSKLDEINNRRCRVDSPLRTSNYRDFKALLIFLCAIFFTGFLVVYVLVEPRPEQFNCSQYPCDGQLGTYYQMSSKDNPDEPRCWTVPQPYWCSDPACNGCQFCSEENWMATCQRRESLYHQVNRLGGVYIYMEVGAAMVVLSGALVAFVLRFPQFVVPAAHYGTAAFLWGGFVMAIAMLTWWALFWFMFAFFHLVYLMLIRHKFPDAVLMMASAAKLATKFPSTITVSVGAAFFQACWFMGWGFVFVTMNARLSGFVDFLHVLNLLWFFMVIKYVAATTVMGVIATWYFDKKVQRPAVQSFKRASTTSLGSIAFGSLLVAFAKFLKVSTGWMRYSRSSSLQVLAACAKVVEVVLGQFNAYGFVQVAVYGKDFFDASKAAFELLAESGLRLIMVDDVVAGAVTASSALMGFVAVGIAWALIQAGFHGSAAGVAGTELVVVIYIPCFLLGMIMGIVSLEMVESVIISLYTCFAEEPHMLEKTDLPLYTELVDLWYGANEEETETESDDDSENGGGAGGGGGDSDQSISDFTDSEDEEKGGAGGKRRPSGAGTHASSREGGVMSSFRSVGGSTEAGGSTAPSSRNLGGGKKGGSSRSIGDASSAARA